MLNFVAHFGAGGRGQHAGQINRCQKKHKKRKKKHKKKKKKKNESKKQFPTGRSSFSIAPRAY